MLDSIVSLSPKAFYTINNLDFGKNHSTTHALNYSISQVKEALNKNEHILGIFIDLSKAFNTMDHNILLKKPEHYGIRGHALSLLASFLKDRTQVVSVLGEISEPMSIIYGTTRQLFRPITILDLY